MLQPYIPSFSSAEAEGGSGSVIQPSSDEHVIDGDIVINKKAIGHLTVFSKEDWVANHVL